MTCPACGVEVSSRAKFCDLCGKAMVLADATPQIANAAQSSKTTTVKVSTGVGKVLAMFAVVIAALALVLFFVTNSDEHRSAHDASSASSSALSRTDGGSSSSESQHPASDLGSEQSPSRPSESNALVTPYDFMKNPFQHSGSLIHMEVRALPIITNGAISIYTYQGMNTSLRFNRMLEPTSALYDVRVFDASLMTTVDDGQLIVDLPDGTERPEEGRDWIVEPLKPTDGTNGFGAAISVATVRFWDYENPQVSSQNLRAIIARR